MEFKYISKSYEDTLLLASKLSNLLNNGDVLLLEGDLGAGKTCFAKGIGKGLNIKETIISPTFNIVRCYFEGRVPLYHIDAYRLEGINTDIGLDEYLEGNGICLVEWGEFILNILPKSFIKVSITIIDENTREYLFMSNNEHYDAILEGFKHEL